MFAKRAYMLEKYEDKRQKSHQKNLTRSTKKTQTQVHTQTYTCTQTYTYTGTDTDHTSVHIQLSYLLKLARDQNSMGVCQRAAEPKHETHANI